MVGKMVQKLEIVSNSRIAFILRKRGIIPLKVVYKILHCKNDNALFDNNLA
jgi:hypothetical protein